MKHCDVKIIAKRIVCGILNPCYNDLWFDLKRFALICHKFWFCVDDLIHCVGGTRKKYCLDRPLVPSMWPMQVGINLIQFEVTNLEEAWFVLCEVRKCAPWTLFANGSTTPCSWLAYFEAWPKTYNNKLMQWTTTFKLSTQ